MTSGGNVTIAAKRPRASARLILAVLVVGVFLIQFTHHGTDWGAYRISLAIDCSVIIAVLFGGPILALLELSLARRGLSAATRLAIYLFVGVAMTFTFADSPHGYAFIIGRTASGATVLSERNFVTPAGGGEQYVYAQVKIAPAAFEQLMADADFEFVDSDATGQKPDVDYERRFRFPVDAMTRWRQYERSWTPAYDKSTVFYDLDRHVAHAKRIQG